MLFDQHGNRKYLTPRERLAFMRTARTFPPKVLTFCLTLAYTGCRISEALALTPSRIDHENGVIVFETLKRRRRAVFRAVPVPGVLLTRLRIAHENTRPSDRLWPWCRTTAWKRVKEVMAAAGITSAQAMPKALRHAFGVLGTTKAGVSLNLMQKWLGHARIQTTAIYADAVGPEERSIAARMWR
jgi:integrase/recombinase XerD